MPGLASFLAQAAPPFVVLAVLAALVVRTDRIVQRVFPDLEWERNLGWLNIRAERRARRALRWVGYGIVVLLLDALVGILWSARGFPALADWSDPWVMGELALRVPALGLCLLVWVIYLGCGLLPRLRCEREEAAFRKFRAEMATRDEELAPEFPSRSHAPLAQPRHAPQPVTLIPRRGSRRHPPGG